MASSWKESLSASRRYEIIQQIQSSLPSPSMSEAIAIEQAAYQDSSSLDRYEAACLSKPHQTTSSNHTPTASSPQPASPPSDTDGIRIGKYTNCHPIADGVTSDVYRSSSSSPSSSSASKIYALKVITAYKPLEPHNPQREIRILKTLHPPCIPLVEDFRDQEQRLVLVFPYMQYSLAGLLDADGGGGGCLTKGQVQSIFTDILHALADIHAQGMIHRDIKPSAVLLASPSGPAYLSDFGTAWHPTFSTTTEPAHDKILDIGTGPYRAAEVLFGNKSYGPPVDMWGLGVMLSEVLRTPPSPIFESRPVHEDGNQLGLILSIFKTLGTPTRETWPEAKGFKVEPFELWTVFSVRPWEEILPDVDEDGRELVARLLRYDGKRETAEQALKSRFFA